MKYLAMAGFLIPAICFSADLTTNSGKTYKNYSVRKVSEKGIQIFHSYGGCIVPFDDLPDDVRAKYRSQEEKILAEQRQKKLEEEKQERLRKLRAARDKLLKNIEFTTLWDIQVVKVLDAKNCICYFKDTGQDFIITGFDTTNISDGGVFPCLDIYYENQTHNFSATFTKRNGKLTLDYWNPHVCWNCHMQPPKIADENKLAIALYNLQKTQCPKETRMRKRHRLYYVGTRTFPRHKYMVFTVNRKMAVKFAKANPTVHLPKLKEPRSRYISTPVYRPVSSPGFSAPVRGINANSMEAQMLQGRSFY